MSIYLDNAATTKVDAKIFKKMEPYFTKKYANPIAIHQAGEDIFKEIETKKDKLREYLKASNSEVVFTSGATESNNFILKGIARANKDKGNHIITSKIEHSSIIKPLEDLQEEGFEVDYVKVDKNGQVDMKDLENKIKKSTILISIMGVNNELGSIQDIKKIGKLAKEKNIIFHSDVAQAIGHIEINMDKFNLDALTVSGHKIYGPKGAGLAVFKQGIKIKPLISGGGQNNGFRSGTLNTSGIVGIFEAVKSVTQNRQSHENKLQEIKNYFYKQLQEKISKIKVNGNIKKQAGHVINIRFEGVEGEAILMDLSTKGIYVSTGSACSAKNLKTSRVIKSLDVEDKFLNSNVRFSFSKYTTKKEINEAVKALKETVERLRSFSPVKD